ncbi:MAG: AAA family ATPase [Acutalibacter muris]|nr:AAA family ATPase [Acutalibacter muris]
MNDKNDIDSILDSMFRGGVLNVKSQAAKDAEKSLEAVGRAQQDMSQSLQESIERMTREAQADMDELQRRLESDGVSSETSGNTGSPAALAGAFETARRETLGRVLGQEEFVNALTLAFKRPFVAGSPDQLPLCRAALLGSQGTGRRSAVESMTASLGRLGVLKTPKTSQIDLAAYSAPGSEKLLVQDLFSALKGGAASLVFVNYEGCHPSVLPLLFSAFTTGRVPLPGRYAQQKGLLIDVGTALAPGAVSELSLGGKYLFLLAGPDPARLSGAFGSVFTGGLDDVLSTGEFSKESLTAIARLRLEELKERTERQLSFTLSFGEKETEALAAQYSRERGAAALGSAAEGLYKAMSEEKLRRSLGPVNAALVCGEKGLVIEYEGPEIQGIIIPRSPETAASAAELSAVKEELSGITGLENVKEYVLSLEDNFNMQRLRKERGLKAETPSMHMIFTGNPGTGKTTVARIVARYLKAMGSLSGGQLVEVTRADLVGQYVGHTAPLTQKALQSAMGGVLFIDEAYSLYRGRDDSFGLEAIDALVKGMEDHRDKLVVILAGYSREMEEFLTANSGLRSRFPNIIEFPDYTPEELWDITVSIASGMGYKLDESCKRPLIKYYTHQQISGDPRVNGNGRMARNRVEAAVIACSRRNMKAGDQERDLELLLPEDFGLEPVPETNLWEGM